MLSGTSRANVVKAGRKCLLAMLWAATFMFGLAGDIRVPDAAVMLFDRNIERAAGDVADARHSMSADQSSSIA